jgi:transposase
MVDLVQSGRTPEALSREFEPTAQAIWNWVRQADRDEGHAPLSGGPATPPQN